MKVLKKLSLSIILSITSLGLWAQNSAAQDTSMIVNGVCGMCQMTIEKAARSVEGVHKAHWNKDTKVLRLSLDTSLANIEKVNKAVNASGYDTEYSTAPDEAYYGLHSCCHYRDPQVIKDHEEKK